MQTISIVGLGKLGSPFLATCASRGFNVIGVDVNSHLIWQIKQGRAPVDEPGLTQLISKNRQKVKATLNYSEAINNSDITFIVVPTPSTENGAFSNKYVVSAVRNIGRVLSKKNKYHLIVVTSTVMPKSMDTEIIPALEKSSGKKLNVDFGVCYNPEFIALGSVINNLLNPDLVLVGQSDKESGNVLEGFYQKFCLNKPPIIRMNFINAEISKLALNSYITTKISFANTLAQIAQKVPGGDVDVITNAIGQDSRISAKYLKGGLPYGGPCFPRDNRAFSYFAKKLKVKTPIAKSADSINENLSKTLADDVARLVENKNDKVSILGLAYKPDTDVAEESAGVKLANHLAKKGIRVSVWDPKALKNAELYLSEKVHLAENLQSCLKNAAIIVITTQWSQFKDLKIEPVKPRKPLLLDCWRILDPLKYKNVARYRAIGLEGLKIDGE